METESPLTHHLIGRLARSPLFAGLQKDLLAEMVTHSRQEQWPKGKKVEPSVFLRRFYVVIQGRIEAIREDSATRRHLVLFVLGPGDGYDILPVLDGRPHEAPATALDDSLLVSFPIEQIRQWLDAHPRLNHNLMLYATGCLRQMEHLATDLALHDTLTRLARLILRHVERAQSEDSARHSLRRIHDFTHDHLAAMVGSVRQVVNRQLKELERGGAIAHNAGGLVARDLARLRDYAEKLHPRAGKRPDRP